MHIVRYHTHKKAQSLINHTHFKNHIQYQLSSCMDCLIVLTVYYVILASLVYVYKCGQTTNNERWNLIRAQRTICGWLNPSPLFPNICLSFFCLSPPSPPQSIPATVSLWSTRTRGYLYVKANHTERNGNMMNTSVTSVPNWKSSQSLNCKQRAILTTFTQCLVPAFLPHIHKYSTIALTK